MRSPWLLAALALLIAPALALADEPPKAKDKDIGKNYQIPYRLTDSGHLMVRIKINGKGPFNFIVDTGAPLVYVSAPVAKKLGLVAEKKGPNTLDKVELEGGPVHTQFKCLIDTPFQLEGMNAMGFAGVELHGILGYTMLSHYKMEIDLTRDKMTWTRLDFVPPAPQPAGIKETDGIDSMGKLVKFLVALAKLQGIKGPLEPELRGFVGIELRAQSDALVVKSVLKKSPAAAAGLQSGDVLIGVQRRLQRRTASSRADVLKLLATTTAGQHLRFTIQRGDKTKLITVTAGEGL